MSDSLGDIMGPLMLATTGAGTAGNIYSQVEAGKTASLQQQQLKNALLYQNNPSLFAQLIQSFLQPISGAETQLVTRAADASGAGRGLSDSPGLMDYIVSQALAPYAQSQEQQAATEAGQVAFPSSIGNPNFPSNNMSSAYAMLMKMYPNAFGGNNSGGGSNPNTGGITGPGDVWGTPGEYPDDWIP